MSYSKKPLQQHSQINISAEIGQFIPINQEAFAELLTFIDFAEQFTLGLVEVNFPPDVDLLIAALQNNRECENIQFCILNCSDPNLRFLRDEIVNKLPEIELEADKKLVLIVRGLENAIGVFGDYPPVLQDLNFVRDAYKRTVPHPILFILPDYAITRLAKFAPDFWAWSSGIFRFKTPSKTIENAISQTQNSEIIDRLEPPEKQERIDLLHRLLMEYKPTGQQSTAGSLRSYSNILHELGRAYLSQRKPETAREYLEEAAKIAEGFKEGLFQTEVINTLGDTYYQQRQFETAIKYYEKSLMISRQLENRPSETYALFKLGNAYLGLRQFSQAATFYQQCLEIEGEIGDRYNQASTYHQLGIVAEELREWEQAKTYYQQALDIKIEYGDRYSQASTYHELGRLAQKLREWEQAKTYYQQALDIFIEYGDRYSQARTYHNLGILAQNLRAWEQAKTYYQQALDIKIEYGDRYNQARTYYQLGKVAEELGEIEQAKAYYLQDLQITFEFNDEYGLGISMINLARFYQATQDESLLQAAANIWGVTVEELKEALEKVGF